ncbi:hypothetical protein B296_00007664 [Ensete ventricosum]|uniref:Uncharacterized protein n=1 Tax=Ensete ventricosum TaxID=4639 RepID=A0A427ANB8_ENSVE|nr:hypothetical protein B296_00007664 [Ensete ventricosum]
MFARAVEEPFAHKRVLAGKGDADWWLFAHRGYACGHDARGQTACRQSWNSPTNATTCEQGTYARFHQPGEAAVMR